MSDTQVNPQVDPVPANFNSLLDVKDMKFRWKKDKLDNQRPTIEAKGFVPSVEGIAAIFNNQGKGLELLQEVMYDTIRSSVADYLNENEGATAESIDWTKFTWDAIANQSREDRRASSITPETWEAFAKDYIAIMPGITNKNEEAVTNATIVYLKKFSIVRTDKDTLSKLKNQLSLYVEHTKNGEQFQEILTLLFKKLDVYLKSDDVAQLVANL